MTPPAKIPDFRLPPLLLDGKDPFVFQEPTWIVTDPSITSFVPKTVDFNTLYKPGFTLGFPKIFGGKPFGLPVTVTPPSGPRPWMPSDTGQLIVDIVMAIDSLNLDLNDLTVNGGVKGCRYSEVVTKERYEAGKETCKNSFDAGTKSDVHMEFRPVEGKTYSELNRFTAYYKKFPGRTGNRINGFYLTNPNDKNEEGPLKFERDDPFESGKDFRDAATPSYDTPIGKTVPYSPKSSRLIMRPIGWLYDEGPGISFDISENMLKAWGILDKKTYTDLGIEPFQFPRRIDKLLRFFPLPRPHDPNFILADGCYDKLPGAKYVRPNTLNNLPALIDWLNPETLAAEILFRKTSIPLNGRGYIELGDKGINRVKIKGDASKLVIEIELGDIPNFRFNQGGNIVSGKGVKAGKITLTLPPLSEINKEFASAPKTYDDLKAACESKADLKAKAKQKADAEGRNLTDVLDEMETEAAKAKDDAAPKKDHSAFMAKLLSNIQVTNLSADELTFERSDRGLKATLTKPVIKKAVIDGTKSITFTGLDTEGVSIVDEGTKLKAQVGKSGIQEIKLTQGEGGPIFELKGLNGKDISVGQNDGGIIVENAVIGSIKADLSVKDRVQVTMKDTVSNGKIDFKNPIEGYEFHTAGNSNLSNFELSYLKSVSGNKISAKATFSGEVKTFSLTHPLLGSFEVVDTQLTDSSFGVDVQFPPEGSKDKPIDSFAVDINVKKSTLKSGHLKLAELAESKLTDGKISLKKTESGLSGKISGNLDLNIPEITIPLIELALKGFSIEGLLKDIGIKGAGEIEIKPEQVSLIKLPDGDKPGQLRISGFAKNLVFRDDPSVRKDELKKIVGGSAIKTEMNIESAKIEVKDLDSFVFVRPNPEVGRKADLKKLKVSDISLTNIEASAKIWAKFPIFGWLRGTFPQIGTIAGKIPDEKVNSELRLGTLDIDTDESGKTTSISNLLIQLFEVGGQTQKAKFKLPSLTLSPKLITTGKEPIELELYFKDLDRGGDFSFSLENEDLSHRGTRPKK